MAGFSDHREFDAWKLSDAVRVEVDRLTADPRFTRFPRLKDQMQRAADSPCPNIAEGFSRFNPRDFARFVRISRGSLSELLDHMTVAVRRGAIDGKDARELESLTRRARGACTGLICYLETCDPPRRTGNTGTRTRNR